MAWALSPPAHTEHSMACLQSTTHPVVLAQTLQANLRKCQVTLGALEVGCG